MELTMARETEYWKAFTFIAAGAFLGLLVLLALRVEYYEAMSYNPNMAPQIAYYFSPFILIIVLIFALPVEAVYRKILYSPQNKKEAFIFGVGYSTLLTWWAFPDHVVISIILNPLVIRFLLGITRRLSKDALTRAA